MNQEPINPLSGELLDDELELTLADLCRTCMLTAEQVIEYVEQGIVEPKVQHTAKWRFEAVSIRRVHCAQRLQRDLKVNTAGAALALDLLEELEQLRQRIQQYEN